MLIFKIRALCSSLFGNYNSIKFILMEDHGFIVKLSKLIPFIEKWNY